MSQWDNRHERRATQDSILSHNGLADLVENRTSKQWERDGGTWKRSLGFGIHDDEGYREARDLETPSLPPPSLSSSNSALPFPPSISSPPPAKYSPHPLSYAAGSSSLNSFQSQSLDYPASPNSPLNSFYPQNLAHSHAHSSSPRTRTSFASLPRTIPSSEFEEPELEWIPSFDKGSFEGVGGQYQHGVGFGEHSTRGKKGKFSEEKLANRMKKLERQFGEQTEPGGRNGGVLSMKEEMKRMKETRKKEKGEQKERSGVDQKGRLVVGGKRKRALMRWSQGIGAMVVGVGSIGASLLTHSKEKPPPSGSLPLIILYILPFISLICTVYLFVLRPCLFARRAGSKPAANSQQMHGMFPLYQQQPQQHPSNSSWCECFGGGGNKRNRTPRGNHRAYQPPSINLIMDPSLFPQHLQPRTSLEHQERDRRRRRRQKRRKRKKAAAQKRESAERDVETDLLSSSSSTFSLSSASSSEEEDLSHTSTNPRSFSSILAHVNLEERWKVARKQVKWNVTFDCIFGLIWGGVGIWAIGWGEKCPVNEFEGYCNLYNTAVAFSILLASTFFLSFTFDCVDLNRAKVSPRHRQQKLTTGRREGIV